MLENVGNAITRLPMTDWDETWVVASNQRLYRKTFSSLLMVVTANRAVNVLVLRGVEIDHVQDFDEIWITLCHCVTKK